jgi:hypothetical protein
MIADPSEQIAKLTAEGWTIDKECEARQAALRYRKLPPGGTPVFIKSPDGILHEVMGGRVTPVGED